MNLVPCRPTPVSSVASYLVDSSPSASESGGGAKPPAKTLSFGSTMTRMFKAKRAQRKAAKARIKSNAKAKAKANENARVKSNEKAKANYNGKMKAMTNKPRMKMHTRYSIEQSAPISILETSEKQPSTEMRKKTSSSIRTISKNRTAKTTNLYLLAMVKMLFSNIYGNAFYHISSFAPGD